MIVTIAARFESQGTLNLCCTQGKSQTYNHIRWLPTFSVSHSSISDMNVQCLLLETISNGWKSLKVSYTFCDWFHFSCVSRIIDLTCWKIYNYFQLHVFVCFSFSFIGHNSRSNPINADVLYLSDKKRFKSSHFNQTNALIIYLHGFSEGVPGGAGQSSQEIRDGMYVLVRLHAS